MFFTSKIQDGDQVMNLRNNVLLCLGLCGSLCASSDASQFIPLGFLDCNCNGYQWSSAAAVDATGHTVVGGTMLNGANAAFIWQQSTGMQPLEVANGATMASAITPDGQTIVGRARPLFLDESFMTNTADGFTPIGNAAENYPGGSASDVSDDGKIVVGSTPTASKYMDSYRWTQQDGFQFLGDLPGGRTYTLATGISGEGSTIVGYAGSYDANGNEAFRWTQASGLVGLGRLPGGNPFSEANDVSDDGAVIVGGSSSGRSSLNGREAFRWDQTSGMVGLGFLPNKGSYSIAASVTPDGSVIVGSSGENGDTAAFVWDAAHGMRSLQNLLNADPNLTGDLTGWNLAFAAAISANGKAIVGEGVNPQGRTEAFLVLLDAPLGVPEPSSLVMCITLCVMSLGTVRQRRAIRC
jgi:probable HAF family extracellular repeat protein